MGRRLIWVRVFLPVCLLCLLACQPSLSPRERMLQRLTEALKNDDWNTYKRELITTADMMHAAQGGKPMSPFKKDQSYTFGVLKPRLMEERRAEFDRARAGGEGLIDFSAVKFLHEGTTLGSGAFFEEGAFRVHGETLSLFVQGPDGEMNTKDQGPHFVLVVWEDEWKLAGLIFPDAQAAVAAKGGNPS